MSCKDQQSAYKEAEGALAGAVLERQQASEDLASAEAAAQAAQEAATAAAAVYEATQANVVEKADATSSAHSAWMQCLTGGITRR